MDASTTAKMNLQAAPRSAMFSKLALWAALTLLVALTIYGFIQANLLHQDIWTEAGLRRFLTFTAGYSLFFVFFSAWKPSLFPAFILTSVLVYSVIAAGTLAALSVVLVWLSSVVLGQAILVRCGVPDDGSATRAILAGLLGLSLYMFVLSIAALQPVNYPAAYLAALAAPLIWQRQRTIQWLAQIRRLWRPLSLSRAEQFATAGLLFVLMLHWLVVLLPEIGPDGLSMHLVVPAFMSVAHSWHFDVTKELWAVMPKGANWLYALCYLLGGEAAARLFNFSLLLGIVGLLVASLQRWLAPATALLLAALFAATPLVQLVTGSLFVENLWTLLGLGALISLALYRERNRPQFLYLAFVLLGAAVATKAIALAFLPPFALIVFWTFAGRRGSMARSIRHSLLALACFLVFAAPPYWIAAAKTGNPVFPYFDKTFPGKYQHLAEAFAGPPPTGPRTFAAPFYLTFHTGQYREVQDGALGFQYFLFLPLGLLLLRRKWPDTALLGGATFTLFTIATLLADPGSRYFYGVLPMAMLFLGGAFASMRNLDVLFYRVSTIVAVTVLCLDIYFIPSSGWMFKDFVTNPASRQVRAGFVTAHAPERNLIDYLNRTHSGVPVAFFESNAIAGLRAPALTTTWHNVEFYHRMLEAPSAADCWRTLRDNGVHFVIAPLAASGIPITTAPQEQFLRQCTEPELTSGNFYAGRVKDQCQAEPDQPASILPPGEYDDWDARLSYSGLWSRLRFEQATNGTITASASAGARVVLRFTGSEIIYVYTKAFNRGIAEILLDGASQGTLDLYSPAIEWKTATPYRASAAGPHTFEIRVTGRKNQAATDLFVDVDAMIVR